MLYLFSNLNVNTSLMLIVALLFVLFYEVINGFHDTANVVAIVIYTRAMHSQLAVIMAGVCNFLGVILGGLSVAYAIVHLLPTDLLLNISSVHGLAMVFCILLAAIIWNLSTWHFGLPASSSHTLIGAIIGIGLTHSLVTKISIVHALNLPNIMHLFLSLIISPIVSMLIAGLIVFTLRHYSFTTKHNQHIHMTPAEHTQIYHKHNPPFWTRVILILSAIGVSFSHGANDGQKGIGLLMLVLISIVPAEFVLNMNATNYDITRTRDAAFHLQQYYRQNTNRLLRETSLAPQILQHNKKRVLEQSLEAEYNITQAIATIELTLGKLYNLQGYSQLTAEQRSQLSHLLMCITNTANNIAKMQATSTNDQFLLKSLQQDLLGTVEYAPLWIIITVALALSTGTLLGWQRVATTISEKIGKKGMTYAQGVSAQITAALSIGISSYTSIPVSTTHVLSSAVAGTMIMDGGGVQIKTVKNILLAWLLTLPASMLLASYLYWMTLNFI